MLSDDHSRSLYRKKRNGLSLKHKKIWIFVADIAGVDETKLEMQSDWRQFSLLTESCHTIFKWFRISKSQLILNCQRPSMTPLAMNITEVMNRKGSNILAIAERIACLVKTEGNWSIFNVKQSLNELYWRLWIFTLWSSLDDRLMVPVCFKRSADCKISGQLLARLQKEKYLYLTD